MKIAISIFNAPWHVLGGAEIHSWKLSINLSNLGDEVHFFYADSVNESIKKVEGVYLHPIRLPFIDKLKNRRHLMLPLFNWRVQKEIKRMDIDVFHSQNHQGLTFGKKLFPQIVTIHTSAYGRFIESIKKFPRGIGNDIFIILEHLKALITKKKIKFISVSNLVFNELQKNYSIDATVIPNGVDKPFRINKNDAREYLGIKNWKNVILFFSRVTKEKGPHKLVELLENNKNYYLLIGGSGPFIKDLQKMIREKHLKNRIKILGYVNDNDLKYIFSAADCFALPSDQAEGQPITIIEAMSYGLACYVSKQEWVPSYLKRYSIDGELNEGIVKALNMGKINADVMTWLDIAKKTQFIYNKCKK